MDIITPLFLRDEAAATATTASPKDPGPVVVSSIWTMFAVSSIFLALRVYCRGIRVRAMWWDDYLLIAGWVFILLSSALITELMRIGFGLSLAFSPHGHLISTTSDDLNKVALGLTKTSFALTLLRVATGWQRYLIWFLIASMNIILAVNAVTTWMAACDRVGIDAYEAVLPNVCWRVEDSVIVAMVANSYSALVDFILALLPWKIILSLQMKRHEKIGVAVAMSLGLLAGIVGVVKIVQITTITGGEDIPYRLSLLFIWGQAEPNVTVIAASIPVLRVLFRDLHRTRYGAYGGSSSRGAGTYLKSDNHSKFPRSLTTMEEGKMDDGSDKSILSPNAKSGIVRTREIAIKYDSRSVNGEEPGVFEMTDQMPIQRHDRAEPRAI